MTLNSRLMPNRQTRDRNRPKGRGENGHSPRPRRPARSQQEPAPTHAEQLRAELTAMTLTPEALRNTDKLADRLNSFQPPQGTNLRIQPKDTGRVVLFWENLATQHCIQLDVNLRHMRADYEYSMVCNERNQLKPFPTTPLGSVLSERTDLNLNRQAAWSWIEARVRATATPIPRQANP